MAEFELKKQLILDASVIVDAKDGTDAARLLHEWKPSNWTMRDGDQSSAPHVDRERLGGDWSEDRPVYEVRACRGHFHVTGCGEDLAIPGDPFLTRESAQAAAAAMAEAAKLSTPTPGARA